MRILHHQAACAKLPLIGSYLSPDPAQWALPSGYMPLLALSYDATAAKYQYPCPYLALDMPQLGAHSSVEVWSSKTPVQYGQQGDIHFAANADLLFGCCHLAPESSLEKTTQHAYSQILHFLGQQRYAHLLRIWNYFPRMNQQGPQIERYQHFCVGRHLALQKAHLDTALLPSATAVGSRSGALTICFVAALSAGKHLGNPRQVNAYEYPKQYGPSSPSFARATLQRMAGYEYLFISGTASIVGHQSLHHGQPLRQLEEALCNLEHLLQHTQQQENTQIHDLQALQLLKVYLRDTSQYALLKKALTARLGDQIPTLFVQGDICRKDLLLEIEGLAVGQPTKC